MYKHILYATDLSKPSLDIEKKVSKIRATHNAKLSIIHVVNFGSTVWMGGGGYFVLGELEEERLEEGAEALETCAERLSESLENSHVVQGTPNKEIVKYAKEIDADLIILGSHGHFQASDLLGTTAMSVLNKANCDVLIVQSGTPE